MVPKGNKTKPPKPPKPPVTKWSHPANGAATGTGTTGAACGRHTTSKKPPTNATNRGNGAKGRSRREEVNLYATKAVVLTHGICYTTAFIVFCSHTSLQFFSFRTIP
ncbi:hypothetical protein E1A91_A13G063400v1 [Gossypium mustelinum]|uniref:Uncharacterized protein n=1 Tax=Gossypium mustelinum TaxID=34275 RepID=A0A5D2WEK1_GOSMU|nr:hypothetical protein E1A91_A13G063400v1 [Gossypium mustelinum]